jgi:hypothetical protein
VDADQDFRELPPRIRPDDYVETVDCEPPPPVRAEAATSEDLDRAVQDRG